jgi:hypothetical protein
LEVVEWIDVAVDMGRAAGFLEHNCSHLISENARVLFSTAVEPLAPFPTVISPGTEAHHSSPNSVR